MKITYLLHLSIPKNLKTQSLKISLKKSQNLYQNLPLSPPLHTSPQYSASKKPYFPISDSKTETTKNQPYNTPHIHRNTPKTKPNHYLTTIFQPLNKTLIKP